MFCETLLLGCAESEDVYKLDTRYWGGVDYMIFFSGSLHVGRFSDSQGI